MVPLYFYANIMETRVYNELNIIISIVSVCALHNFVQSSLKNIKIYIMLIVLKRDYGQLGNRLHTHANLLAWCIENDLDFINLSFITEAKHFESKFFTSIYKNTKSKFWKITLNLFRLERILKKIALSDKWIKRLSFLIKCYDCDDTDSLCVNDLNKILEKNKCYLIVLINCMELKL